LGPTPVLRSWRKGDRFEPFGASGSLKVQDLFVNRKVPRLLRDEVPLLASGNRILWVVGLRAAREGALTNSTARPLQVDYHGDWRCLAEALGLSAATSAG
jgi:tRNA(Ile)-lysidine synthase